MAKEIPLTRGKVAIVDDEDYDRVSQYSWCAHVEKHATYAKRGKSKSNPYTLMHRFILSADHELVVDHVNRDGLDNRRKNLRVCSRAENARNCVKRANNKSGFKGVTYSKAASKWTAQLKLKSRHKHIGVFSTPEEAARAYDKAALELYGEYALLNFPPTKD